MESREGWMDLTLKGDETLKQGREVSRKWMNIKNKFYVREKGDWEFTDFGFKDLWEIESNFFCWEERKSRAGVHTVEKELRTLIWGTRYGSKRDKSETCWNSLETTIQEQSYLCCGEQGLEKKEFGAWHFILLHNYCLIWGSLLKLSCFISPIKQVNNPCPLPTP